MKIVIAGCSGFVGTQLKSFFEESGAQVVPVKIRKDSSLDAIVEVLEGSDMLINLAVYRYLGAGARHIKKFCMKVESTQHTNLYWQ